MKYTSEETWRSNDENLSHIELDLSVLRGNHFWMQAGIHDEAPTENDRKKGKTGKRDEREGDILQTESPMAVCPSYYGEHGAGS